jgi:hypothetical protein
MQGSIVGLISDANGMENCIVVTILSMFEKFELQRLFCPTLVARYCRSSMGNDYFWHARGVSMLEEKLVFLPKEGIQ